MKRFFPSIGVVVLLAVGACGAPGAGGGEPNPPAATRQENAPTPAAAEPAAEPALAAVPERDGEPVVKLLEPGQEPRSKLRYTPPAAQKEAMSLQMKMALAVGTPDAPGAPAALPGTNMRMNVVVDGVAANGDVSYRFDLSGVDVLGGGQPPELLEQIRAATAKLVGMGGKGLISSRGLVKEMHVKVPAGVDPATKELLAEMERSMRQMCDPLPEEPIGKGARWDVHTRYSLRGLEIDQVRRYTLAARDGQQVKLSFIVEQTAKPQSMKLPNLPPKATVKLEQLASAGDGDVTLDTTRMVPRSSKMGLKTTSVIRLTMEGQRTLNRTDMEVEILIGPDAGAKP